MHFRKMHFRKAELSGTPSRVSCRKVLRSVEPSTWAEPDADETPWWTRTAETSESVVWQNFGRMLLVFGCIGSDFCKKICVLQHFSKSTRLSSWNFWNLVKFCKFCDICKIFAEFSQKLLIFQTDFLQKFWDCSGARGCKSCRAWKMLSNAYFLAKFRFDTAENEPAKNLQNFRKMHFRKMHFSKMHFSKILQIFGGLVLGCIKTKFCKKICVWQHFSSSTRFASSCTAAISKFLQKICLKNQQFLRKFSKNFANVAKFAKFYQISKISAW